MIRENEAHLTVKKVNGRIQIVISMSNVDYADFEEMAQIRGVTMAETIAEALRLERLFAEVRASSEKTLFLQQRAGGELRELVAV